MDITFRVAKFFVCAALICAGTATTQTGDRILTFGSQITIDRDRTMHVDEKFEVVNDSGVFDSGIYRRLWIKPIGPQRTNEGSFQSVSAKIDGRDAVFYTDRDGKAFDIRIVTEAGTLPRGDHVIELSYTAKHQFLIYKGFEDLNQDVTGEWPVPIENARVELMFSQGVPTGASISADTGTDSSFQFDCVRTELSSGWKFETTHPLPPGNRLLISTRFVQQGYFASSIKEEGYRAILQNHPLLLPGSVSVCGLIGIAAAAFIIWRRAPRSAESAASAVPIGGSTPLNLWTESLATYGFAVIMFVLAIIPGFNFFTYSGHGGPGWLVAPLCFPWVIVRTFIKIAKGPEDYSRWYKGFFKFTVPYYFALSLPLSWAAVTSIRMSFGLQVSPWAFFAIMISPFPWWYFT